jgi:SPP1 family predicted phage head-tail adaptor
MAAMADSVGGMRHLVEVQYPFTVGRAEHGGEIVEWRTTYSCFASIEPLSGREQYYASQTKATTTHKIILRHTTITPKHRILWEDRIFEIDSIVNRRELQQSTLTELLCTEQVAEVI